MKNNITIEKARYEDIENISSLVRDTYKKHASNFDSEEGKKIVLEHASKKQIEQRFNKEGSLLLIAKDSQKIIGMIEIKNYNHITLFFVDEHYFRQGVGKKLFEKVKNILGEKEYSVNATPSALQFYEHIGFECISKNVEYKDGISYISMIY